MDLEKKIFEVFPMISVWELNITGACAIQTAGVWLVGFM